MLRLYRYIKKQIQTHKNSVVIEGVTLTIFLLTIGMVMSVNIYRVITNGKSNYETYLNEKASLAEIQSKNLELQKENTFVNSDEYRKLILRETSNYASDNERLFETKENPVYFQEQKEYYDLSQKTDYTSWWVDLIKN